MKMKAKISTVEIDDKVTIVCVGMFEICRISPDSYGKYSAELSDEFFIEKTPHEVMQKLMKKFNADDEGMVTVYSTVFGKYTVFDIAGDGLYRVTQLKSGKLKTVTVCADSDENDVWRMIGAK